MVTLLNILRSSNIKHDALHSLAQRLEEIYNDMEIDGKLERNELQASKRLVRQAFEKEKEARRDK